MITYLFDDERIMLGCAGDIEQLCAETCIFLAKMYGSLLDQDVNIGKFFRHFCENDIGRFAFEGVDNMHDEFHELFVEFMKKQDIKKDEKKEDDSASEYENGKDQMKEKFCDAVDGMINRLADKLESLKKIMEDDKEKKE